MDSSFVDLIDENVDVLMNDIRVNSGMFYQPLTSEYFGLIYMGFFEGKFRFEIICKKTWFLAKIKYGF